MLVKVLLNALIAPGVGVWLLFQPLLGQALPDGAGSLPGVDPGAAHQVVKATLDDLLIAIAETAPSYSTEPEKFYSAIDEVLGPAIAFERIARRVMAKHYRVANADQRQRFARVFKQSLLQTYAKGLLEIDGYRVHVLPPSQKAKNSLRNTKVHMEVETPKGQRVSLVQSMFYSKKNQRWMMQNVVVAGVNIGLLFRDQFARILTESQGNIDRAIDSWTATLNISTNPTIEATQESHVSPDSQSSS